MDERFLQFVWKYGLYDSRRLRTVDGTSVKVLSPGQANIDAGPDFFNARIQIGATVWAGNVEVHQRSSEWYSHKHDKDAAYNNVVLHVVKDADQQTVNERGQKIPILVIHYPEYIEVNYDELMKAKGWIVCQDKFHKVDLLSLQIWFHSLMIERLQQKTGAILERLKENNLDWNETFYQFLGRNFGFKTNALPFEMLARAVPLKLAGKHVDNLLQLEALFFGAAGLLNEELVGDDYFMSLKNEFSFLYKKFQFQAVPVHLWKFLRLRPVNFPTIRIAQFAALIHQSSFLFSQLIDMTDLENLKKLFRVKASAYWDSHYRFNRSSPEDEKWLGESSFANIVINTFVPFLFVYGEYHSKQELKDRALDFLEKMPPEDNSIIEKWKAFGIPMRSAFDTQSLLQLKNEYCDKRKCLNCPAGSKIVKSIV